MLLPLALALASPLLQAPDADGDGLSDFAEVHKHRTDPRDADSDGDGAPDGDWLERREFTYVVRSVVQVMKPVTPEHLTDDFQDARVLDDAGDRVELEVVHYPFSTAPEALPAEAELDADDPALAPWLAPGPTSDWDAELRERLRAALAEDGIDVDALDGRALVERAAAWLLERAEHVDSFTTFATAFDADGEPYVPDELLPHVGDGAPPTPADWAREVSAKGMFEHRTRGSCTSSAIYLSGCLRALGVPTRTVLCIPLFDAGDEREWELVRQGIQQPYVRRKVLAGMRGLEGSWASHTFNEVFLAGRWWRLDYHELGVGILRPERFGLLTHVATFRDWADARMPRTVGRRQALGERDAVLDGANPYSLISVRDAVGPHCTLALPEAGPLTARIAATVWTDDPELPDDVRAGIERADRFGLLARVEDAGGAEELRELLAVGDRRVHLEADGRPTLSVALDPGCWWYRGDHALVYLPFGPADRRDLALDVPYRVRPRNGSPDARVDVADGLVVVRERELPAAPSDPTVRGVVRDAAGAPVSASVSLVGDDGSVSVTAGADGRFALRRFPGGELVLQASTADGRIAVRDGVRRGSSVDLVVEPGAALTVELAGRDSARFAVFSGDVRVLDLTVRRDAPERLVVPPGELRLRLYVGDGVLDERTVVLAAGEHEELAFAPDAR